MRVISSLSLEGQPFSSCLSPTYLVAWLKSVQFTLVFTLPTAVIQLADYNLILLHLSQHSSLLFLASLKRFITVQKQRLMLPVRARYLERRQKSLLPIARRKISVDLIHFSLLSMGSSTSLSTQRFAQQWVEKLRQLSLVAHHLAHVLATSIAELESQFLKDMDLLKLQQVQLLTSQRIFASVQ